MKHKKPRLNIDQLEKSASNIINKE